MERKKEVVAGLLEVLVKKNIFAKDKAQAIEKLFHDRAQSSFVDFLLQEGFADRAEILNALSQYYQVPAFDVAGYFFEHELLRKFPKEIMLEHAFIPLEVDQNMLIVIAADPGDPELLDVIGDVVSYALQFMVGLELDITDAIKEFYDASPAAYMSSDDNLVKPEEENEAELDRMMHDFEE